MTTIKQFSALSGTQDGMAQVIAKEILRLVESDQRITDVVFQKCVEASGATDFSETKDLGLLFSKLNEFRTQSEAGEVPEIFGGEACQPAETVETQSSSSSSEAPPWSTSSAPTVEDDTSPSVSSESQVTSSEAPPVSDASTSPGTSDDVPSAEAPKSTGRTRRSRNSAPTAESASAPEVRYEAHVALDSDNKLKTLDQLVADAKIAKASFINLQNEIKSRMDEINDLISTI